MVLINIPFGYWRAAVKKFSVNWFLAVHLPVPFVYAIRYVAGVSWELSTFPVLIAAFFAGQFLGSKLRSSIPLQEPES